MMDEETVDILDENNNVVKKALKTDAHKYGWKHKTVIGYLKSGRDCYLVRQASDKQDAGQLVAPVGGHVKAGESEVEALLRECEEEIGTRNIKYKRIGSKVFHRKVIGRDENHLFALYEIETNDPIKLGDESVAIVRFSTRELKLTIRENPEKIGDAHYFILESFYPEFLPKTYVNRWTSGSSYTK